MGRGRGDRRGRAGGRRMRLEFQFIGIVDVVGGSDIKRGGIVVERRSQRVRVRDAA